MKLRWFFRKSEHMKANIKGLEEAVSGARAQATEAEDRFRDALKDAGKDLDDRKMIAGALVWRNRRNG